MPDQGPGSAGEVVCVASERLDLGLLFCEGWSVSSCVLERALKLEHLQWGR